LEVRSLGARHALYVIGYAQQRFLIAASPTGVTLLSHLPTAENTAAETLIPPPSFTDSLLRVLGRKA
jgi:flagellar biogenesis protein FliO